MSVCSGCEKENPGGGGWGVGVPVTIKYRLDGFTLSQLLLRTLCAS